MEPAFDPGGFSVDLRHVGTTAVTGDDLLRNGGIEDVAADGAVTGWTRHAYVWLDPADAALEASLLKRVRPLMRWESNVGDAHEGKRSLLLGLPRSAHQEGDPPVREYCPYWRQSVAITDLEAPGRYVLSFVHRGECVPDFRSSQGYVRATFYDRETPGEGSQTRVYAQKLFVPDRGWRKGQLAFLVPKATRRLDVRLALRNCGRVSFDKVSLHRCAEAEEEGVSVRLMPWHFLKDRYCLATGDAGTLVFGFRNEAKAKVERPQLLLQLPEWIEIVDLDRAARPTGDRLVHTDDGTRREVRIDISAWKGRIRDGTFRYPYNMWQGLTLLVRTSRPAGEERYAGRYWLEDGAYRSAPRAFQIQIVPPFAGAATPRQFRIGTHLFLVQSFVKPEGVNAFAKLYRRTGLSAVHVPPSPLGAELGRLGIERYTQPFANGYTMGDRAPDGKPEHAVFRLADGQPRREAICPVEVYTKGDYFRSRIENDTLRRILVAGRQAEQIMCNWEPFMYNGKGCFCGRCKDEFRAYSKLSRQQVDRVWPKSVTHDHHDTWIKFRSWQHGKLMVAIEETVHAVGKEAGRDSHFIPEIHYGLLTESWADWPHNREFAAIDYLGRLPALLPWAPYNWYVFGTGPYDYVRGRHLNCHTTAMDVKRFLRERLPATAQPRLFAFPYGTYEGVTEPEAIAFEVLTYFVNGYHGAFVYLFPGGYDARYWAALAEANGLIAQFEDLVMNGTRVRDHTLTRASPLPRPDPRFLSAGGCLHGGPNGRWNDLPLLLSWEFEHHGERLIVVGNFWERGECFFRLNVRGLDASSRYVLREPAKHRCHADRKGSIALAAAGLADGLLLHVGAMRYSFFVVEKHRKDTEYGSAILPQQISSTMQKRLPEIRKSCMRTQIPRSRP